MDEAVARLDNRKLGVWAFIGSESLFFAALIGMYMVYRGRTGPPAHQVLDINFTAILAFILLMSSLTMVLALKAIREDNQRGLRIWLSATIFLGLLFLAGQAYEFTELVVHEHVTITNSLFGASFFTLTGFHGTHVAVGVIWLGAVLARAFGGGFTSQNFIAVEIAGLYWHFVDLVWVVIFTLIYLI
ncbi:MAG: cytochrome oxidase subunit III [Dehalococcoidia bacterium]|nr:cytochrome oxidase subunit III [Dehalococcoidia bacterium]